MSSKSKDVRLEQRRVLEKKLELRLQKLSAQGISDKQASSDTMIKSLKSKIRETNVRIATVDKNTAKIQELKQAKEAKLAAKSAPKEEGATPEKESKSKKKAAPADKAAKKQAPAEGDAAKKPRKKKEEPQAE